VYTAIAYSDEPAKLLFPQDGWVDAP
jgi:hypothetical protein